MCIYIYCDIYIYIYIWYLYIWYMYISYMYIWHICIWYIYYTSYIYIYHIYESSPLSGRIDFKVPWGRYPPPPWSYEVAFLFLVYFYLSFSSRSLGEVPPPPWSYEVAFLFLVYFYLSFSSRSPNPPPLLSSRSLFLPPLPPERCTVRKYSAPTYHLLKWVNT